ADVARAERGRRAERAARPRRDRRAARRHLRHPLLRPRRLQRPAARAAEDSRRGGAALMETTAHDRAEGAGSEASDVSKVRPLQTRFVALALVVFRAGLAGLFLLGLAPERLRKARLAGAAALLDAVPVVNVTPPSFAPAQDDLRLPAD